MKKRTNLEIIIELVNNGVFNRQDIAYGIGMLPHHFEAQYGNDVEVIMQIEKSRVWQKARLNETIMDIVKNGGDFELSNLRLKAARFLLESLHNQSERAHYFIEKLRADRNKTAVDHVIKAAKLANDMDENSTLKLVDDLRKIKEAIG